MSEGWVIRPDGPDGRVDHFYADGDEKPVEVVKLSAFLAEREARERAEEERDEARVNATWYQAACKGVQTDRDAAVARAEQAERDANELLRQRDEWANRAAQEGLRAEQAEAERDELRCERAYLADQISWEPGRKDEMGDEITPVDDALSIMAELGRERDKARKALSELVRLKDGPRDDAYRAAKDAAWDCARAALSRTRQGNATA